MSDYLMLDITTPPHPVPVLLLANQLGYRGPTIVKLVLCLEPSLWAWALAGSGQGLYCLVEAGWTAGSMHLYHSVGTSQAWANTLTHALLRDVDFNHIIGALGAHLDNPESGPIQCMSRGMQTQ